ncbi:MAG: biotin--[acetyl-CoA-carboxylase] ligase [Deltaproteobacteria bacterium]|nr:biotin--[acetyl-CoA-carboxylase] ligase [Deltaproteobacteria bacterium]
MSANALEARIREELRTRSFARALEVHDELSSTNDRARAWLVGNGPSGLAVIARAQSKGRGRLGRTWSSAPDAGLYVSFGVRVKAGRAPDLPLLAGLASARAIERSSGAIVWLKWPNDLMSKERKKVGGVLIEASAKGEELEAVVGIGINLHSRGRPEALSSIATSLEELSTRGGADLVALFVALAEELEGGLDALELPVGRQRLHAAWTARAIGIGERVSVGEAEGVIIGLAEDGALVLETKDGRRKVYAGDLLLGGSNEA